MSEEQMNEKPKTKKEVAQYRRDNMAKAREAKLMQLKQKKVAKQNVKINEDMQDGYSSDDSSSDESSDEEIVIKSRSRTAKPKQAKPVPAKPLQQSNDSLEIAELRNMIVAMAANQKKSNKKVQKYKAKAKSKPSKTVVQVNVPSAPVVEKKIQSDTRKIHDMICKFD